VLGCELPLGSGELPGSEVVGGAELGCPDGELAAVGGATKSALGEEAGPTGCGFPPSLGLGTACTMTGVGLVAGGMDAVMTAGPPAAMLEPEAPPRPIPEA
jgi:hypothetical protein